MYESKEEGYSQEAGAEQEAKVCFAPYQSSPVGQYQDPYLTTNVVLIMYPVGTEYSVHPSRVLLYVVVKTNKTVDKQANSGILNSR